MTSKPKTYEGATYVSHKIERVEMRRAPIKRWKIDIEVNMTLGGTPPAVGGFFDLDAALPTHSYERAVDRYIAGIEAQWKKRTSTPHDWLDDLRADLLEAVNEG